MTKLASEETLHRANHDASDSEAEHTILNPVASEQQNDVEILANIRLLMRE